MKKNILVTFIFLMGISFSQNPYVLEFSPLFGSAKFNTETYYKIGVDSVQITTLKFYVSNISFYDGEKQVWKENKSYHLADINDPSSLALKFNLPSGIRFTEIKFNLGVDSITNVSGAMGGALDPALGMYWTWQSGYINFKLEGNSNLCKTRNNEFQFHLGGYLSPFSGLQEIRMPSQNNKSTVAALDLQKILSSLDLKTQNHIMSPSKEAVNLARLIGGTFTKTN